MTNETRRKIDKAIKISLIIAGLLLIANDAYYRWHGRSSSTASDNVNRTVESIQRTNESARSEVESARREVEAAEGHIERAADAVSRSEVAAARSAAGIDNIQTLVSECKGIVEAQRRIIQDVDRANGIGAQESEKD